MNLAEIYRTPVVLLLDEVLAHMREKVTVPDPTEIEIVNRHKPDVPASWYRHFEITPSFKSPMASFGEGYRFHVTGLTHDEDGFPSSNPAEIQAKLRKLRKKITNYRDEICEIEYDGMDDAHVAVFSYGTVARATEEAIRLARHRRMKVGYVRPKTIWPFHDRLYRQIFHKKGLEAVIVAELNQGQLCYELQRVVPRTVEVVSLGRYDSELLTPVQILNKIREVR
jgi:2-oxoglutarate ferredoxin oxidoreductase subunit alpha